MSLDLISTVGGTILVLFFGIIFGLVLLGIDRVLAARMQARIGPPLSQPFTDVRKLFTKENIIPENAIPFLFNIAPIVALASTVVVLLYLPFGGFDPILSGSGDLILVMYLLTMPALALVAGGFASGSPYATVGAQREMVTMIAYEFPLAIVIIAIAWKLATAGVAFPFSLTAITAAPIWGLVGPIGLIGVILLLVVLLIVTPAEVSRVPFDTPEAETELAGGVLVEYSGKNLAMFYIAQGVKTLVMSTLIVALFFPYGIAGLLSLNGLAGSLADIIFFVIKVILLSFVSVSLIRVAMARFRINQVVSLYWIYLAGFGILGLILVMLDPLVKVV